MILKRLGLALALVAGTALLAALLIAPASAAAMEKGTSFLSFQLMHGDADFTAAAGPYISAYPHSEWGGQIMYQRMLGPRWALALSAGVGTFKEKDEPDIVVAPGALPVEYTQSSWNGRIGFDRVFALDDDFNIYMGPGIQYWKGHGELDNGTTVATRPDVSRIAISGRVGGNVTLGRSFGLNGYLGGFLGSASSDEAGAKATWMPSGHDGAVGVSFKF